MVTVAAYVLALGAAIAVTPLRPHDIELFAILLLFGVVSIELTKQQGEATEFTKDVHGIWHIPVAILLPPVYCMLAPILKMLLVQWRVDRKPLHRRAYTAASHGLSYGAASVTFHAVQPRLPGALPWSPSHWLTWTAAAAGCALLQAVLNNVIVLTAVKGSDPSISVRAREFTRDPLYNDLAEIAAGTSLAVLLAATRTWLLLILMLPLVTLLQRSLRHAQLADAARFDAKTGLLNAATWQREALAELCRARDGTPATLAILDIDHFKRVNDTHGHLAGDNILVSLAETMRRQLRDYDITGRFGGEEFTILLPRTAAADAVRVAERLRAAISAMADVTVSIGLVTSQAPDLDLDEMLLGADAALYRAKAGGRNRVCVLPDIADPAGLAETA